MTSESFIDNDPGHTDIMAPWIASPHWLKQNVQNLTQRVPELSQSPTESSFASEKRRD